MPIDVTFYVVAWIVGALIVAFYVGMEKTEPAAALLGLFWPLIAAGILFAAPFWLAHWAGGKFITMRQRRPPEADEAS